MRTWLRTDLGTFFKSASLCEEKHHKVWTYDTPSSHQAPGGWGWGHRQLAKSGKLHQLHWTDDLTQPKGLTAEKEEDPVFSSAHHHQRTVHEACWQTGHFSACLAYRQFISLHHNDEEMTQFFTFIWGYFRVHQKGRTLANKRQWAPQVANLLFSNLSSAYFHTILQIALQSPPPLPSTTALSGNKMTLFFSAGHGKEFKRN